MGENREQPSDCKSRAADWLDRLADYLSREERFTTDVTLPDQVSTVEGLRSAADVTEGLLAEREQLRELDRRHDAFVRDLAAAFQQHGVPALLPWDEAIDSLAAERDGLRAENERLRSSISEAMDILGEPGRNEPMGAYLELAAALGTESALQSDESEAPDGES